MSDEIVFTIPQPLSYNMASKLKIQRVGGRTIPIRYNTAEALAYKNAVMLCTRLAANINGFSVAKNDILEIRLLTVPLRNRGDRDNGMKLTQDAIADALGINDSQIKWGRDGIVPADKGNPRGIVQILKVERMADWAIELLTKEQEGDQYVA